MGQTPEWCECRLKNVDHKDDPWVLADRIAHVFYVLDPEIRKYVVVS
jgi:hypothetical protein